MQLLGPIGGNPSGTLLETPLLRATLLGNNPIAGNPIGGNPIGFNPQFVGKYKTAQPCL